MISVSSRKLFLFHDHEDNHILSSKSLQLSLPFTFRSLIHLQLIFVSCEVGDLMSFFPLIYCPFVLLPFTEQSFFYQSPVPPLLNARCPYVCGRFLDTILYHFSIRQFMSVSVCLDTSKAQTIFEVVLVCFSFAFSCKQQTQIVKFHK